MNKFTKIPLYAIAIFAAYSLVATYLNRPIFGESLLFLLFLACPLMFLFMDHGGQKDDKKARSAHQH